MSYYRENTHILYYLVRPKYKISAFSSPTQPTCTLKVKHLPFLYINWMHLSTFEDEDLYFTKADKNTKVNRLLNQSLNDNMDDTDDILDIDSWFDDKLQSSMIFIFIACIIALIAFVSCCSYVINMRK